MGGQGIAQNSKCLSRCLGKPNKPAPGQAQELLTGDNQPAPRPPCVRQPAGFYLSTNSGSILINVINTPAEQNERGNFKDSGPEPRWVLSSEGPDGAGKSWRLPVS